MVEDVMARPAPAPDAPRVSSAFAVPVLRTRPPLGRWWALLAAVASGLILLTAFPPIDQWWTAPIGVALFAVAVHRRGFFGAAGLGLITGLALFIPLLSWAGGYVGSVWLFLPAGESGYLALLAVASAWMSPVVDRWRWTWPVAVGTGWVLAEALRDRTPFGGFPWGRLAFSQGDSPLLRLAAVGGAPLVTFGVGAVGGLLALVMLTLVGSRTPDLGQPPPDGDTVRTSETAGRIPLARRSLPVAGATLAVVAVALTTPLALPTAAATGPRVTVAIVQGNVPRLGLEFNAQRRAVLDNHVNATLVLAEDVAAGRAKRPAFVVWPENASDIDPLLNSDARARIDQAAAAIGVPILVGGLLEGPGDKVRNVGLVWEPDRGVTQTYVKRHPVPFAEYMPIRSFARMITDKVDLIRSDFLAGPTPGVLRLGPATIGDVICFEVAYDNIVRDTVTGGAQLLVVQTNNATFTEAEALQQLAMVRLRAVEHGRPALMASTVGVSAFVDESGKVYDATRFNAKAVIGAEVSLGSTRTMATRLGLLPEVVLCVAAVGLVVTGITMKRSRKRSARTGVEFGDRRRRRVEG